VDLWLYVESSPGKLASVTGDEAAKNRRKEWKHDSTGDTDGT